MRITFTILLALASVLSYSQTGRKTDSVTFCKNRFRVPEGCVAASQYQVQCGDFNMVWIYMNEQMLPSMPDQLIRQIGAQVKTFKKEAIKCYLLDQEVKGYKISFSADSGLGYQLIAYGIVNTQPVMVQISLDTDPSANEKIPAFARQILKVEQNVTGQ
jgi:hypothetical protein